MPFSLARLAVCRLLALLFASKVEAGPYREFGVCATGPPKNSNHPDCTANATASQKQRSLPRGMRQSGWCRLGVCVQLAELLLSLTATQKPLTQSYWRGVNVMDRCEQ